MKLIQTIKDIIFKIKDYDRLELDYSAALDYATGGVMSKTNYTREAVYETIYEHWKNVLITHGMKCQNAQIRTGPCLLL